MNLFAKIVTVCHCMCGCCHFCLTVAKETASSAIHVDEFTTRMQQMYQQGRTAFKREYEVHVYVLHPVNPFGLRSSQMCSSVLSCTYALN